MTLEQRPLRVRTFVLLCRQFSIPPRHGLACNANLKQSAKELRKAGLLHEALMWNHLKWHQFTGLDFDRQKIFGNSIGDFSCAERASGIELDGSSHDGKHEKDARRDDQSSEVGADGDSDSGE